MKQINISQICIINAVFKEKCKHIEYREKTTLFGITISKDGYYDTSGLSFSGDRMTEEKVLEDSRRYIKNKVVYYYPHLELYMTNGARYYKWFVDEEEMERYIFGEELKINKWIRL